MNDIQTLLAFYGAAAIAVISTFRAICQIHAVRALLYLIVSFLSVAIVFFLLGAPFAAALEVITYAGAIMVLFVFVVMTLNLGPASVKQERDWLQPGTFVGPGILVALLLVEWIILIVKGTYGVPRALEVVSVEPEVIGEALFTRYLIGVELASMLLLAGLVGAYHVGYRKRMTEVRESEWERTGKRGGASRQVA